MKKIVFVFLLVFVFTLIRAQNVSTVSREALNPDANWEANYQLRVSALVNAKTYNPGGFSSPDDGKSRWTQLLCEMYKKLGNSTTLNALITSKGASYVSDQFGGTFCGPFSASGLTQYFFQFKNVLPPAQIAAVENMLSSTKSFSYRCSPNSGWQLLMRPDLGMDPIWAEQGLMNEKNSENYHWMLRMNGYLFAETYGDAVTKDFFKTFVKNWIRALYNSGRVEWSSNNYFGHTLAPLQVLYMHAQDPETKAIAKAGLDWLFVEESLHYIDGFQAGADVRAKTNAYQPFAGSTWGFNYLYFTDPSHLPTYSPLSLIAKTLDDFIGYSPYCDYRPTKTILDIAWRNYPLPVEIQSAKPFYEIDFNDYKNWKGDTITSRKFEFETIWQDKNLILSSLATYSPDGGTECLKQKSFWEQSLWRFAVKGTNNGAIQITGNAGFRTPIVNEVTGRYKYEQIGQFRNVMLRAIREDSITKLWIIAPKSIPFEFDEKNAFADVGNDIYLSFKSYNALSMDSLTYSKFTSFRQFNWRFEKDTLGALAMEIGTKNQYGSYANFKAAIQSHSSLSRISANVIQHNSAVNHTLKMEYMPTASFTLNQGCVITNAGVTPKVWGDGNYIDFETWDSYKVSYGKQIIKQVWGSGVLQLASANEAMQIKIDPISAVPAWGTFDTNEAPTITSTTTIYTDKEVEIYPNPAKESLTINVAKIYAKDNVNVRILDVTGNILWNQEIFGSKSIDLSSFKNGLYFINVRANNKSYFKKIFVEK